MDIFQAIILGLIQGITEWLPISSKSHLIIVQHFFGVTPPIIFDLMLHIGSLIVVFLVFWKDIKKLIVGLLNKDAESVKLFWLLVLALIPLIVLGYFLNSFIKSIFYDLRFLGWGFLFAGLLILLSRFYPGKNYHRRKSVSYLDSFIIGLSQVLALFPGVSRSGSTISTGMLLGIDREVAARFSFLLFIPTIIGATIFEFREITLIDNISVVFIGLFVAMISGYLTLKMLLHIIRKNYFSWFSIYCFVIGIIVLLFAY